ncbi:MAG: alanine racemase [Trueperaceae bacterium]|nr:alanine racemase [Trueperaceae bacterium]
MARRPADLADDAPHATVDLTALAANVAALRARTAPGTRLMAAVKADAYGHGVARTAPALVAAGVDAFGVAEAAEALDLRALGVSADVLVFAPVRAGIAELAAADVALTVADAASLAAIERAAPPRPARVHLKVDTGMGRLGASVVGADGRSDPAGVRAALALAAAVDRSRHAVLEGVWTHLACADDANAAEPGSVTGAQVTAFEVVVEALARAGLRPATVHAANSAATIARPDAHFDLVRPGIAVYGQPPSAHVAALAPDLRPALTLDAPITFVKRVAAGTPIGYGATWRAPRATTVATVRLGYADGFPRALSSRGRAVVGERSAVVAGRVCMDQVMLDLGPHGDARVGDRAVFVGGAGPTAVEVAEAAGSFVYELLTRLGPRIVRRYVG